ncbi:MULTISPECIES: outer membrane protein [Alphaproteobacteria]|uniref:Outer membrane protein n=2 Tax=Alphaproteobacteria TaxID=28211 RepID=A0A512HNW7_9HYPH|nr:MULTISPECIES: outer membrane protein [Alphaproteobacteria]GEO87148.1 outer membrane protein [Ciceribacter naphthalenivorans]GLR23272.1 outer membrane protein [Ciceribacter naphthalenivorans]GLT06128.1 outer membrane protein [Sphingomonas psychrolutea]
MTKTVNSFALVLMAAFATTPALAADLAYSEPAPSYEAPAATPSGFTGAYAGIHAGVSSDSGNPFDGDKEFMGGIQGGYNTEMGGAIVGGELEYSHLGDTKVGVPGGDLSERHRLALKAKAGMALGDTLLYGTAGMAMTSLRDGKNVDGPDGWKPGYLLGLGVEQNLNANLSAKVEYNYVHTNDVRSFDGVSTSQTDVSDHVIKGGVNYKF